MLLKHSHPALPLEGEGLAAIFDRGEEKFKDAIHLRLLGGNEWHPLTGTWGDFERLLRPRRSRGLAMTF